MALSPEDQRALQHEKEMLEICLEYRRVLEKQRATFGLDALPRLSLQIKEYTEEIERHKAEIDRLETLNVEGASGRSNPY